MEVDRSLVEERALEHQRNHELRVDHQRGSDPPIAVFAYEVEGLVEARKARSWVHLKNWPAQLALRMALWL